MRIIQGIIIASEGFLENETITYNRSLARHVGLWLKCMQCNVSKFMFFMTVNEVLPMYIDLP